MNKITDHNCAWKSQEKYNDIFNKQFYKINTYMCDFFKKQKTYDSQVRKYPFKTFKKDV